MNSLREFWEDLTDKYYDLAERLWFLADFFSGLNLFLRTFLTRFLDRVPRRANGKNRMIYLSEAVHLILFPCILLYNEILMRIINHTGVFQHLIYPILFGLGYGILLNIPTTLFPMKINRRITIGMLFVIDVLYIAESIIKDSYSTYMPLNAMLKGAGGVATGYSAELKAAITGNIFHIFLFLLPLILYLLFGKKNVPALRYKPLIVVVHLIFGIAFSVLGGKAAASGKTALQYGAQYEFNTATAVFGLPASFRLSIERGSHVQSNFVTVDPAAETPEEESFDLAAESTESTESAYVVEVVAKQREVVTGEHRLDLDLNSIVLTSKDQNVISITNYLADLSCSSKNMYTGLFEGKNLILICAEAFSDCAVDPVLTPTLYRLVHNGIYFSDYYQPSWGGSTSTGEYSFLTGLVPGMSIQCMQDTIGNNMYMTIGNSLQRIGYANGAFHNGEYNFYNRQDTHPNMGYGIWLGRGNGMYEITGLNWPQDDIMLKDCTELYLDEQPFSLYFMTVNGHSPYSWDDWVMSQDYIDKVFTYAPRAYDETTLLYLAYQQALEKGLKDLVNMLEEKGIADDTVICLTADHYPYGLDPSTTWGNDTNSLLSLYGVDSISHTWEHDHNTLIIWSECLENEDRDMACEVSEPTYSLDILPTLLNLFGVDYDSRLLPGRDVFSGTDPLVLWNGGSWITNYGKYDAYTYEFYPNEGVVVPDGYVERISNIVSNKITLSNVILTTDYYSLLFGSDNATGDNRREDIYSAASRLGTNVKDVDASYDTGVTITE